MRFEFVRLYKLLVIEYEARRFILTKVCDALFLSIYGYYVRTVDRYVS